MQPSSESSNCRCRMSIQSEQVNPGQYDVKRDFPEMDCSLVIQFLKQMAENSSEQRAKGQGLNHSVHYELTQGKESYKSHYYESPAMAGAKINLFAKGGAVCMPQEYGGGHSKV